MAQTQNNTNEVSSEKSTVPTWVVIVAWLWAGIPLAWGIVQTAQKASALFQ